MEQMNHLEAAVLAAGMSCVYIADDWSATNERRTDDARIAAANEGSAQH